MKNQLIQAMAAIEFANKQGKKLYFHMNGDRVEQKGEQVLKNIEALFAGSKHELVKWPWLNHADFSFLVSNMNLGMQVSLSESFNIVTADFVFQNVPIVVGDSVEWMPWFTKADNSSAIRIAKKLAFAYRWPLLFTVFSKLSLEGYNLKSLFAWKEYFKHFAPSPHHHHRHRR